MLRAACFLAFVGAAIASDTADTAPAISIKTKAAEISVEVDRRLRAHPGLFDNCVAEGRPWAANARSEAAAEYKDNREWFSEGRQWEYGRTYKFRSLVAGRYVSIVRSDATYTGAAHPNLEIDTILWDRATKKRINVRRFFQETADNGPTMTALATLVRIVVVTAKHERIKELIKTNGSKEPQEPLAEAIEKDDWVRDAIQPELLKLGPITLAPSTASGKSAGLTFHFSPYAVDSYAAGPYTVFVPWTAMTQFFSPEGATIFGGQRPGKDNEDD